MWLGHISVKILCILRGRRSVESTSWERIYQTVWVTINLSPWSLPSIAPHGAWSGGSPGARTDTGPPSYSLFIGLRPLTTQPYKYTPWGFFVYHGHSLCNFFYHCYVHINKHLMPKKFCTACIDWQYCVFLFLENSVISCLLHGFDFYEIEKLLKMWIICIKIMIKMSDHTEDCLKL